MLVALFCGPLLHIHDRGDGHAESFVHAHLPEADHAPDSMPAIDSHSQEHGRSIDLFAVNTPVSATYHVTAEFVERLVTASPVATRAVLSVQSVRAHSPPDLSEIPPRSPPTL
jgi:hypothetical protein